MNLLKFKRTRQVKAPERGHDLDAGIDFFIPTDLDWEFKRISPGDHIRIPSGIQMDIPPGWCMTFLNKSGVAYDKRLIVGAQLIDSGYQGEVHLHLINIGADQIIIKAGMKICQGIFLPVPQIKLEETYGDLFDKISDRSEGSFGSTGGAD